MDRVFYVGSQREKNNTSRYTFLSEISMNIKNGTRILGMYQTQGFYKACEDNLYKIT